MIPILYDYNEQAFTSNGLGRLSDCISCIVTEERNGIFELEFQYPVNGMLFEDILEGRIIACTHDEGGDIQPFEIYRSSKPINGIVTFNAHHISYRLGMYPTDCHDATTKTCQELLTYLASSASLNNETWTFTTDITGSTTGYGYADGVVRPPISVREHLGGTEGSILDIFGGEYEFDKWSVKLWKNRGANNGVRIVYGKNLVDFKAETDYSGAYTHIVPYYTGDYLVLGSKQHGTVYWLYDTGQRLAGNRVAYHSVDFSDKIENGETKEFNTIISELTSLAASYATTNKPWEPSATIDIDFVQLWQTEEYKNYAPLLKCRLCDSVNVSFGMYGLQDMAIKVVKVEWDALLDRYQSMTLGGIATGLGESITSSLSGSVQAQGDTLRAVSGRTYVSDVTQNGTSVVTDGVAAVTVPSEPTLENASVSGSYTGSCNYLKFGRMVIFDGTIATSGSLANGAQLASGLPANHTNGSMFFALNNNSTSENVGIYVNSSGNLLVRGAYSSASRSLRFSGAYIAAS